VKQHLCKHLQTFERHRYGHLRLINIFWQAIGKGIFQEEQIAATAAAAAPPWTSLVYCCLRIVLYDRSIEFFLDLNTAVLIDFRFAVLVIKR
jgi:hypothetical protein